MNGYKAHLSFGWKLALYLAIGMAASLVIVFSRAGHPLTDSYAHAIFILKATHDQSLKYVTETNVYVLVIVAILVLLASLLASHRISGPVYRMCRSAESVAQGDFSGRVRVRRKDYLQETVRDMDLTFEVLRGRLNDIKSAAEDISVTAAEIKARGPALASDADELSRLTEMLEEERYRLRERLSFFHTS
jgi:methyl-accepting chemotaxis protein